MGNRGRKWRVIALAWLLVASMLGSLILPNFSGGKAAAAVPLAAGFGTSGIGALSAASASADTSGHWAGQTMAEWRRLGLIDGFPDGSLRPDQVISRIEFVALANRLFAYKGTASLQFADVPGNAWFASQVQAAVAAGYINGFPDGTFKPSRQLTRAEAAVMLAKLVPAIERDGANALAAFGDRGDVPVYARASLGALVEGGIVQGFADGTVRPGGKLTRAEAIVLLDRIRTQSAVGANGGIVPAPLRLTEAGVYGPASGTAAVGGDVVIDAPGITLRNVTVRGNLTIGAAVGEGDVDLKGVAVGGSTNLQGGGAHSVHINDSRLGTVVVEKKDGLIRIVVGGTTVIERMDVRTDANVESDGTAESGGIAGVSITTAGEVSLSGRFGKVEVAGDVLLTVGAGTIGELQVAEGVKTAAIKLGDGVSVERAELHGGARFTGAGTIGHALVDAADVRFETKPANVEVTVRGGAGGAGGGNSGAGGGGSNGGNGGGEPTPTPTSTPTTAPTATPTTAPTSTPTPTPPVDTTVTVVPTLVQARASSFKVALSPAVPGLTAANFALKDAAGGTVEVTYAATLDGGATYAAAAALTEGATYTLTLAKTGYDFGAGLPIVVPVTQPEDVDVTASLVGAAAPSGFTLALNGPVAGLTAADLALTHGGEPVDIASADSADGGATYAVVAALSAGERYLLTIAKPGYRFGSALTIDVPPEGTEEIVVTLAPSGAAGAAGLSVGLSVPIPDLSAGQFQLTHGADSVAVTSAVTEDGGATYAIAASLIEGETYRLTIVKAGYGFGSGLTFTVPAGLVVVTPSVNRLSSSGFVLSLDKPVPELEMDSFTIKDSGETVVGINMLETESSHTIVEVYAPLELGDTYTVSLNKPGYAFSEPLVLSVQATESPSTIEWATYQGFSVRFGSPVAALTADRITLTGASGAAVAVQGVQLAADGLSAVVTADLSAAGAYGYRISVSDLVFSGELEVPETIAVSRYTTFESVNYIDAGLRVHFSVPVPGLPAEAFELTHRDGTPYALASATTDDGGRSYLLVPEQMTYSDYALDVHHAGYDFGGALQIIRPTINNWGGLADLAAFIGLNPSVPTTMDNYRIADASGAPVTIKALIPMQNAFIATFDGARGRSYDVTVVKEGYDFGGPHRINVYARNTIVDPSRTGFALALNPPVAIDTAHAFALYKVKDGAVVGSALRIDSVKTSDNGASYRFAAALTPGDYKLSVDADIEEDSFYFTVPVVATMTVDHITDSGLTVNLSEALSDLGAYSFELVHTDTGAPVAIDSATTTDQGRTYRLAAALTGGSYILKLPGHQPAEGVAFQADGTVDAGVPVVDRIAADGFDLTFGSAVPGLMPANLDLRDAGGNRLSGVTLSTANGGASYRVHVGLTSGRDYKLTLSKDFFRFASPVTFHVGYFLSATIVQTTLDGRIEVRFSSALPEAQYGGVFARDEAGNDYYPYEYAMAGGGTVYRLRLPAFSAAHTYSIALNPAAAPELADYALTSPTFGFPTEISAADGTAAGLTVRFASPVDGLTGAGFIVRDASGTAIPVTGAVSEDGGGSYALTAALTPGKFYTVQYKSPSSYQLTKAVSFAVRKSLAPTIKNVTSTGFTLQFGEKVAGLKDAEVVLRDPNGSIVHTSLYSFSTTDQGLTYQFRYAVGQGALEPGAGYTLYVQRDEFALDAPLAFDIPIPANVLVSLTTSTELLLGIGSYGGQELGLVKSSFDLRDSKGRPVSFAMADLGGGSYKLTGAFNAQETYTLTVSKPGYDFGKPLTFGLSIAVGITTMFQNQQGFLLLLGMPIPDLAAAEIVVKDSGGTRYPASSAVSADGGATYQVSVPLTAGKTYTVTIDKPNYTVKFTIPFSLNRRAASVDLVSVRGFRLNFDRAVNWSSEFKLVVMDDQGNAVKTSGIVSKDNGLSYEIDAPLVPDVNYTVTITKPGDDYGPGIPLIVRKAEATFGGLGAGGSRTFSLTLDRPIPDMRLGEFVLRRASDGLRLPVLTAESTDGGTTYELSADFLQTESYTIVPEKDGYAFGDPIPFSVPVFERTAITGASPREIKVGFNPAVPGLDEGSFALRSGAGGTLPVGAVSTDDDGATYRIVADYAGGETYTVTIAKAGYDFDEPLTADIPDAVTAAVSAVSETGATVSLSPAVGGLNAASFSLRDASGHAVALTGATTTNGGASYMLTAGMTGGSNYTLTIALSGYDFGNPMTLNVPIPVTAAYSDVRTSGLTIRLAAPVPGLTASNATLLDQEGKPIAVAAMTTSDGGATYAVQAALQAQQRYSLRLSKTGYDFGADTGFVVPLAVQADVAALLTTGFTIRLDRAVPGLTAGNLALKDSAGKAVPVSDWTASADGLSYQAAAELVAHETYTLQLAANGYDFGPALQREARPALALSASGVSDVGFVLELGDAVPSLKPDDVYLTDASGTRIRLNSVSFFDLSGASHTGRRFQVVYSLTRGEAYTIDVRDPAHPTAAPLQVILPIQVQVQVSGISKNGFALAFNQAVPGLTADDIELLNEDGQPVAVGGAVAGDTAAKYAVDVKLTEGRAYTLKLNKTGYTFGSSGGTQVQVPIAVTATVLNPNEAGFTIVLSEPVPDLDIKLFKPGFVNAYYDLKIATPDAGRTYQVGVSWPSDYPLTLALSKAGYDLGADRTVQYAKKPPVMLQAVSGADSASVLLTFDAPLVSMDTSAGFALKIGGQWQSGVKSYFVNATTVKLTWSGSLLRSTDELAVAYTGVNRVKGENGAFLAQFGGTPALNASSELGLVQSYVDSWNADAPAAMLHGQFGRTAEETAKLLREGGFSAALYAAAVGKEYQLDFAALVKLLYEMDLDAQTAFSALREKRYLPNTPDAWIAGFASGGYAPEEFAGSFRDAGYQTRDILRGLKAAGASAKAAAQTMNRALHETGDAAVTQLRSLYGPADTAGAVQGAYGLTDAGTMQALAAGGMSAADAAAAGKTLFAADAATVAGLLSGAGYPAKAIGAAVRQLYTFADAAEAVRALAQAGIAGADLYAAASGIFSPADAAAAMLGQGMSAFDVADAIRAAGGSAATAVAALLGRGGDPETVARQVMGAWGTSLTMRETASQLVQGGFGKTTAATMLRTVYGADMASAYDAMEAMFHPWGFDAKGLFATLLQGGYDPAAVADYFLKHVYVGRAPVLENFLETAHYPLAASLTYVHDAVTADGTAYTMKDAVRDMFATGAWYSAAEALAALRAAYANDAAEPANPTNLAAGLSERYPFYEYQEALISQFGQTMPAWIEQQTANCACDAGKLAKDAKFLFGASSIGDITLTLSATGKFTLAQIIEGTIALYPGSSRESQMSALTAVLSGSGYPIGDLAAVYDSEGWDWIKVFSRYGIAAKEAALYLQSKGLTEDQIVVRLRPYPLKDIALVLREQYGLDESSAIAALLAVQFYDQDAIGSAVAWAFGGNPVALWVKTLKAQGASAGSVINLLASRYTEYRDPSVSGPALVRGGYSMDEVMQALIARSSNPNLQNTIAVLKSLYAQEQVTVGQLLAASGSKTPADGIGFMKNAKYSLAEIARSLKSYYGLDSGEAARLLTDAYPYELTKVIQTVAGIYGDSKTAVAAAALAAEGISTLDAAIPYLRDAGFSLQDIAAIARDHFDAPLGRAAQALLAQSSESDSVVLYAAAGVYGQTVEHAIRELLTAGGQSSFADAIAFIYAQQRFDLRTGARLAKEEYGLSSGEALQAFRAFGMYPDKEVVATVAGVYGTSGDASVVDSLAASGMDTLANAVSYLLRMNFDLRSIVRVGREHYGLTQGQTAAQLDASGFFDGDGSDVVAAIASVYGQTMSETLVAVLDGLGATTFEAAIPDLRAANLTLDDLVLAARDHYRLTAGQTLGALLPIASYQAGAVTAAVLEYYGKPFAESAGDLLRGADAVKLEDGAPILRQMGYSLKEIVEASRSYYGLSAEQTADGLAALDFDSASLIATAVADVYAPASAADADAVLAGGEEIADPSAAVRLLWQAGIPLADIAGALGRHYSLAQGEIAEVLAGTALFDPTTIVYVLTAGADGLTGTAVAAVLSAVGVDSAAEAAGMLRQAGYGATDIAVALLNGYAQSEAETKTILSGLGVYTAQTIEAAVNQARGQGPTSADLLSDVLELYGVKTPEGAVAFLKQTNNSLADIALQLKNRYQVDAARATELLKPYDQAGDIALAIAAVYYADTNLSYLKQMVPAAYAGNPTNMAGYMSGKFPLSDIVLALKLLFGLDALGAKDAMINVDASPDQINGKIAEVYGVDPVLALLTRMKAQGASASDLAVEMQRNGKLEIGDRYLVDTLAALGYDGATILNLRYRSFNRVLKNEGTIEEQAALLVRFGVNTPAAMADFLMYKSYGGGSAGALPMMRIMRAGLPNASISDIALAVAGYGFGRLAIENAMLAMDELSGAIAEEAILKRLGYSAYDAAGFVSRMFPSNNDQLRLLALNGYKLTDYLQYAYNGAESVAYLKQTGLGATDIAVAIVQSGASNNYSIIAQNLKQGGFTDLNEIVKAIFKAGIRPEWIPDYIRSMAPMLDIAQAMANTGEISLTVIVQALQIAQMNNKQIYDIIKAISKNEQAAFLGELSAVERRALGDDEAAIIVTLGTLRGSGFSAHESADLLTNEMGDWMKATALLILTGYEWDDALGAVWDEYRGAIGFFILRSMMGSTISNFMKDFQSYWKIGKIVLRIVKREVS
ncbi:S-layer homology domain-containing protein [Cohnella sp. GbtcB17]|uniref:S-layer homology domain-containing protein n=1 Tax=Cohnella sp. GbtcB17 TaxID=2824762 RepID=UPI001C301BF5